MKTILTSTYTFVTQLG